MRELSKSFPIQAKILYNESHSKEKMMYQVIRLYGDFEPWWFLDDWKNDIVEQIEFDEFEEAKRYYIKLLEELKVDFPSFESRSSLLSTFWSCDEKRWCEECDEDLQQYHSLALLQNDEILPKEFYDLDLDISNDTPELPSACAWK